MRRFEDPHAIDVEPGETVTVALSGNAVGGYLWVADELPAGVRVVAERDVAPTGGALGAAGAKEFDVEAGGAGTLRFALRRPWEPGDEQVRFVELRLG